MKSKSVLVIAMVAFFALIPSAQSQQKQKTPESMIPESPAAVVARELDQDIGKMLAAWQLGNIEEMHKYYADDATWVSGAYAPPIVGWDNYVAVYKQEVSRISGGQLIRRNTNFFHYNDTAWVCYQWEFDANVDGRASTTRGQTTLVFVKAGNHWLIVHNHTSQIYP
ncbi:MAG TPA: nuclear transport factor 2 family protein [Candidatus Acidoferrales bacterium]|nr:nuclear transport factor 2 family protein [Candidatus Acidoferrales bacterium]